MGDEQTGGDDQAKRNGALDYVLGGLILVASFITGAIPSERKSNSDADNASGEIAKWTRVVGRWTRGMVIVGVLTIGVLGLQAWILGKTDQTYRSGQRAYIGASINLISVRDTSNKLDLLRIKVLLENSGNTDARNVHWQIAIGADYLPDPEKNDVSPTFLDQGTLVLPPKEIAPIVDSTSTRTQIGQIVKGRGLFYIGHITFADIYDVEHVAKFCLHVYGPPYSPQMSQEAIDTLIDHFDFAYGYCRRNNCSDKDCKSQ